MTTEKPPDADGEHNLPEFSVGEISRALKRTLESAFSLVRVRGEISGFKRAASGHLYMTLKDAEAVLDGVCWKGVAGRLGMQPEDGMEVVVAGRITAYPGRSKYQIVIERMELAGEGALLKLLEERRKKLAAEGLFDTGRKQPIPFLPDVIGVVTSSTGAVIRDILHRIDDRFGRHVLLWPVLVQGEDAARQVAAAIEGFNRLTADGPVPRPDLLIVARGGGSLEDLWAFNEEVVVRAAAASGIPLISAVGHETDTTLIDFAADVRAPTPTAAAEMAVPVRMELAAQIMDDGTRMAGAVNRVLQEHHMRLEGLGRGLPDIRRLAEEAAQRLDDWAERLRNSLGVGIERRRGRLAELAARLPRPDQRIAHAGARLEGFARALEPAVAGALRGFTARFGQAGALLESYSHERVLERGFALVTDKSDRPVSSTAGLEPGAGLDLRFHDGTVGVRVDDGKAAGGKRKPRKPDNRQGKLL
jgi:exodeoxyribonuclease VII large subunit